MQFSHRFKEICRERGITQKKALADMGMGRNAAQSWIDGKPALDTLQKMTEYFGMSTEELLGDSDNKKTPTPEGEREYTIEEILVAIEVADPATRAKILRRLEL